MALTTCPECNRSGVSDQADACPSCGAPVRKLIARQKRARTRPEQKCIRCHCAPTRAEDGVCMYCRQRERDARKNFCKVCHYDMPDTWTYCHSCFPGCGEPWRQAVFECRKCCVLCHMEFTREICCPACYPQLQPSMTFDLVAGDSRDHDDEDIQ